ncbi:MAG: response regulator [Fidelibacterota bacterium]|nr:MAG: response regulator [Candidatus Neomarinimicrobiota bacterium]
MYEVKQLFRESLDAHINALKTAKKALEAKDPEALDSIRRIAHTLRGSAGTVGYAEISDAAAQVEDAAENDVPLLLFKFLELIHKVATEGEDRRYGILIIEDDPIAARILQERLSTGNRDVFTAGTAAEAREFLGTEEIDLILLDLVLPDTDGRNLLMELRGRPDWTRVPVFVVSVKGSQAAKTECLALGADDYFEKPVDPEVLATAVSARLKRSSEMARESRTDPLTSLPNRAAFTETFQRAHSLATRSHDQLSLAILDLDRFKSINDTYGHRMGDEVLKRIGPVMTEALRQTDFIGRWGGEEFVVLFPKADPDGAARALRKALETFSAETFTVEEKTLSRVTFSAGVTAVSEEASVEEAVAEADHLLYLAKESGRNQVLTRGVKIAEVAKKILLAEDDNVVASVVKHRLGKEGFEVIHFPDGTSAWRAAPELEVSLAILDVKMPGMDGFELLGNLRKLVAFRGIPIMMLTSMGNEEDIVRGFELGADDYVMKPFSPVELLARIRRLVKGSATVQAAAYRVLIVDDDPIIRMTASKALEAAGGYEVSLTETAEEAWTQVQNEKPHLIITDLMLPDMDGTDLLERLHEDEDLGMIPVVFLTAKSDPALAEDLKGRGAQEVLHKPFDPADFARQVSTILESSGA